MFLFIFLLHTACSRRGWMVGGGRRLGFSFGWAIGQQMQFF